MRVCAFACSALFVCCTLAACLPSTTPDKKHPTTGKQTTVLKLSAGADGSFSYCDDEDGCQSLPNPNDCSTLVIEIDNQSGSTCETCLDESGATVYQSCDATSVACTLVTLPDPDCVVCAYINGAIIYSSCTVAEPYCEWTAATTSCSSDAPCTPEPPSDVCETCYDAAGNVISQDCQGQCGGVACPTIEVCPEGYMLVNDGCCDSCQPVDPPPACLSSADCADGEYCTTEDGDCQSPCTNTDPSMPCVDACAGVCKPRGECTTDMMCPALQEECAAGYHVDYSYPNCCGACVLDAGRCAEDADCDLGQTCEGSSLCAPGTVCVWAGEPGYCKDTTNACNSEMMCPMLLQDCAAGYHLDYSYPNCCGACVLDEGRCADDADCNDGQTCEGSSLCSPDVVCVWEGEPGWCNPSECSPDACGPALGMPNYLCPDGVTVAGPTGRCLANADGVCGWEIVDCPSSSASSSPSN